MLRASAFALALGILLAPGTVAARTPVLVPADVGWVSSGVTVTADVPLDVQTLGYVLTAKIPYWHVPGLFKSGSGPAGQTTGGTCGEAYDSLTPAWQATVGACVLDAAYFGELIGRVDGVVFEIGETTTITPPATGMLYFTVGEFVNTYGDNHGAFTVLFR
jgi:hypothetical protein